MKILFLLLAASTLCGSPHASAQQPSTTWRLAGSETLPAPADGIVHQVQTLAAGSASLSGRAPATLHFVSFEESRYTFAIFDQGTLGRASLGEAMAENHCLAGTNGGFFQPDFEPLGLLLTNNRLVSRPSRARLLSGALVVTRNRVTIRRSTEPLPGKDACDALQAGPFLVDSSRTVPGLNDARSARRTAVFTDGRRRWGLVATSPLTLNELGAILSQPALLPAGLQIERALNLDGGSSTSLWVAQPTQGPFYIHEIGIVRDFVGIVPRSPGPVKTQ